MTVIHSISVARVLLVGASLSALAACGTDVAPAAQPAGAVGATSVGVTSQGVARQGAAADAAPDFVLEPQPAGAPARVVLQGVDLTGVGYDVGDPNAPILMVEFSDFGCPYCAQHARETFPRLDEEFVSTGRVFYKHVPFVMGMFPNGDHAARAAECAGEQDRFWPMHDSVYAHQGEWKRGRDPDSVLRGLAGQVVPDGERWESCYAADRQGERTASANAGARRLGVRATPTFFVNGQMVEGALPLSAMRQGLNAMLGELGAR